MVRTYDTDVLVLGSGGAGLRAAIEARSLEVQTMMVSKAPAGMNNCTVVAGGGFRAPFGGMTPEEYMMDTIQVGKGLNDRRLVEIMALEGPKRILELRDFGVEVRTHKTGASVGNIPTLMGLGMTKPMVEYAESKGVEILDNIVVTRLLKSDEQVMGAVGYDVGRDDPIILRAKATVLATGGAGALYRRTDCPLRTTGDGYYLAYDVGAKLRDMEFVQFFPLALAEPGQPPYLVGGAITEEGKIMNVLGEDIPQKYRLTTRPLVLKSRDLLSRAVMMEIMQGGGVDGAVLLDAREVFRNKTVKDIATTGTVQFLVEKLQAVEKPFRVAPICHFCMGGVIANEDGITDVNGLYVAGEVMGGVHGANRHGGNALTDILVFGARAGRSAAIQAKRRQRKVKLDKVASSELNSYESILSRDRGFSPYLIMSRLRDLMWTKAGIVRDSIGLSEAFEEINELRTIAAQVSATSGRDMLVALEAKMAVEVAEMIVRGAMERRESRGAHYRTDYPDESDEWLKPVNISKSVTGGILVKA